MRRTEISASDVSPYVRMLLYELEEQMIIQSELKLVNRKNNGKENWVRVFRFAEKLPSVVR